MIGLFLQDACGGFPPRGALPPLTNAGGMALATFLTDDFMPGDILGMNLVLTETTMPGACQGAVIAAGRIVPDPFGQPSCPGDPPPRPGCIRDRHALRGLHASAVKKLRKKVCARLNEKTNIKIYCIY